MTLSVDVSKYYYNCSRDFEFKEFSEIPEVVTGDCIHYKLHLTFNDNSKFNLRFYFQEGQTSKAIPNPENPNFYTFVPESNGQREVRFGVDYNSINIWHFIGDEREMSFKIGREITIDDSGLTLDSKNLQELNYKIFFKHEGLSGIVANVITSLFHKHCDHFKGNIV